MRIVVVGSVALDTIRTPSQTQHGLLGGSAAFAALAAAHFADVSVVAVVGSDFPDTHRQQLVRRGVELAGLASVQGTTFRWDGEYDAELKTRRTRTTEVGVFAAFRPVLSAADRASDALLLGNIDPELQADVLAQVPATPLTAIDTMNYWITRKPDALRGVLPRIHVLLINDEEALQLTGLADVVQAMQRIRALGPQVVVVKKGPQGAAALGPWGWLALPALPLEHVQDPTGAGDAFAGGLIGYLAGRAWRERDTFATGLAVATAMASLAVEQFGVAGVAGERHAELRERCRALRELTRFDLPEMDTCGG
jgi:sugar/nucleoside kinase (ribokinase family)